MKKSTKIILVSILVALLVLGLGYAAIQNITLNIGGTLEADPNQANFNVRFKGTPRVSIASKVTASIESDTSAKIEVKDLTTVGESVTAEYTVENASADLSADLLVSTINSNTEYFKVKAELGKTSLIAKETTTVLLTATLIKAPISESVISEVVVELTAAPVQPGEEETGNLTPVQPGEDDEEEEETGNLAQEPDITLKSLGISNDNIGDYIDLENDIIDTNGTTGVTTDDWRVLYVDEENDKVYVILTGYLPNAVKNSAGVSYATAAGLDISGKYVVYSEVNRDTLINGFKNEAVWNELANGIIGSTVTGVPTLDVLMSSYKVKDKDIEPDYSYAISLNSRIEDYDLYIPKGNNYSECYGYSLASPYGTSDDSLWVVTEMGVIGNGSYDERYAGVRPVVELPLTTTAKLEDGIWKIIK